MADVRDSRHAWQMGLPCPTPDQVDQVWRFLAAEEGVGNTPSRPAILRVIQAWFAVSGEEECPHGHLVEPAGPPCLACVDDAKDLAAWGGPIDA